MKSPASILFVLVACCGFTQGIDLERGLVAYYPFNESARDQSGNNNHGEVKGASLDPGIRCGDGAYKFDGDEDYIDFGNAESLNKGFNRGLTVSFMVYHTELNPQDYRLLIGKWAFDVDRDQFALFLNVGNKISFAVADGKQFGYGFYSKTALKPHEWYHVIAVWNRSGKMGIFINGELDNMGNQTGRGFNNQSNISLKVGRQVIGQNRPYKGYIDEVRLYNRSLSLEEIKALFTLDNSVCNQFTLSGHVYNKKTGDPLEAVISFEDLETGDKFLSVNSDSVDGYYETKLPIGYRYGFYAQADGFLSINQNINTKGVKHNTNISKDLYLVPIEIGSSVNLNNLFFDFNKSTIKEESYSELNRLLALFDQIPGLVVEIGGHTDAIGSDAYNEQLSQDRANAVRDYLLSKDISEERIVAKGYGESLPVATNDTDEGRQQNRRVEFKILAK